MVILKDWFKKNLNHGLTRKNTNNFVEQVSNLFIKLLRKENLIHFGWHVGTFRRFFLMILWKATKYSHSINLESSEGFIDYNDFPCRSNLKTWISNRRIMNVQFISTWMFSRRIMNVQFISTWMFNRRIMNVQFPGTVK